KMAETLGCYGEYVERPDEIRPALDRAQREVDRGSVAPVNRKTDDRARAGTAAFAQYATFESVLGAGHRKATSSSGAIRSAAPPGPLCCEACPSCRGTPTSRRPQGRSFWLRIRRTATMNVSIPGWHDPRAFACQHGPSKANLWRNDERIVQ